VDDADIELGHYRGPLDTLLEGLQNAGLDGALLELDGGADRLDELIDERTAGYPELAAHNKVAREGEWRLGPIRFGGGEPTIPIEGDNIAAVRALLEDHADEEIAFHVSVRDEQGYLLEAPDAGDNVIFVSSRLPDSAVNAIRAALGPNLTPD
jgi:hypothetical protein